ncbi:MAG: acetyl/propionyl/methylcrotonyl-CoA carboxylase subunit alpha [bacterium]
MINTLLVANRGEIALRVIRAARELGIRTAAVFADDDAASLYVEEADAAYRLAGESPRETYLSPGAILDAARRARADAIHPGYGFLSERGSFADAARNAGIVFVGPSVSAMNAVGSKTAAKAIAEKAGVPTIPWADASRLDDAGIARAARAIGFPLLIKASAGGGGRGMRVVESERELSAAAAAARAEASAAFGDGAIFLERFLSNPRHIEVQILGDDAGNVLHFFERECSIQRRHQKIVEESPAPGIDDALRSKLTSAAIAIARATAYTNAGTVEFLVEPDGAFYFIEVNARLQVEHPVTEAVTGIDLVAWQLRIASGERLTMRQEAIFARGHAIECRVTAEDSRQGFLPAAGVLARADFPRGAGVRIDSGVRAGDLITPRYDSLLAKIIVHAETRDAAARRMERALAETILLGIPTNIDFLSALVRDDDFRRGRTSIEFLASRTERLCADAPISKRDAIAIALFEAMRGSLASSLAGGGSRNGGAESGANDPWDLVRDFRCNR